MNNQENRRLEGLIVLLLSCAALVMPRLASASDHADPIMIRFLGRPESNLTGLFAFEQGGKLVVALCARPGLAREQVELDPFQFTIHLDVNPEIRFSKKRSRDEGRTFRYGGWITKPEEIQEEIKIEFRFDQRGRLNPFAAARFGEPIDIKPTLVLSDSAKKLGISEKNLGSQIRSWVGLRDDPFILHGFSKTNVVAMVVEIPFEALGGCENLLVWGTSSKYGTPVDHVGRSLRTMLPRFDFLNGLHPSKHVAAIQSRHENPGVVQDVMSYVASPFFGIRHYDFEPDVLIFSPSRWQSQASADVAINDYEVVAFPNGRRLTDDVAKLMCERGDCLLFEVSTADAHADHELRPNRNGSQFLESFPYLAPPNKNAVAPPEPSLKTRTWIILVLIALVFIAFISFPWILWWMTRKRLHRLQDQIQLLTPV